MITEQPLFTTESFLYGAVGVGVGYAVGWLLKKTLMILFKLTLVLGALFVGALVYLQGKQIININERALDHVLNETYSTINQTIGVEAVDNPIRFLATSLGLPMTSGIGLGLVLGWMKG